MVGVTLMMAGCGGGQEKKGAEKRAEMGPEGTGGDRRGVLQGCGGR